MLWDADISPYGLTEQLKFTISPEFEVSLIAGQFMFEDNPENALHDGNGSAAGTVGTTVPGGDYHNDAYLFYQRILTTFKVTNDITISAAPGFLFYPEHGGTATYLASNPSSGSAGTGAGAGNGTGQFPGTGSVVTTPTGTSLVTNTGALQNSAASNSANSSRNLSIATFNGDVKLGLGNNLKLTVYGQSAYDFKGGARDAQEYGQEKLHGTTDKIAFPAGSRSARTTRSRRRATTCSSQSISRWPWARSTRTSTTPTGISAGWASAASRSQAATGSIRG